MDTRTHNDVRNTAIWRQVDKNTLLCFFLSATIFIACMFLRSPKIVRAPRFWAEEGQIYYQYMLHRSWIDGFLFVFRSNYQLLTNLICLISAHIQDRYAAYPTEYFGLALDIYCCFLISEVLRLHGASIATVAIFLVLFSLQHAGYEVFLNTTNVMWVCSVSTLFIALGRDHAPTSPRSWVNYLSVAVFGLTGISSVALAPFYLLKAMQKLSLYRCTLLGVLSCAAAVQVIVILRHGLDDSRSMTLTLQAIVPIIFQTELASFLPSEALDAIGTKIIPYNAISIGIAVQIGCVGIALLILFIGMSSRAVSKADSLMIGSAMIWTSIFNEFGALGPSIARTSGWDGGRYHFFGNTCFLVLICLSRDSGTNLQRRISAFAMGLVLCNSIVQINATSWTPIFTAGTSVSSQIKKCADKLPCRVNYPPFEPGSGIMVDHTYIPDYHLPTD